MLVRTALPALAMLISVAHAEEKLGEPPSGIATASGHHLPMQIAVNFPVNWAVNGSYAGSVLAGITKHAAVRVNVASYEPHGGMLDGAIGLLFQAEDEGTYTGRTTDVGASLVYYPRALWSGFTFEIGALGRSRDTSEYDEAAPQPYRAVDTTKYAGRAMIGWSWLLGDAFVISWAIGGSMGYEKGTNTHADENREMSVTTPVATMTPAFESYLRFGAAFDL